MATHTSQPRMSAPFATGSPVIVAGLLSAALIGALLARDLQFGVAVLLGLLYVPVALLNLPLGVVLWIPLAFIERLSATSFGPTLVAMLVGAAWLGLLPARAGFVASFARRHQVMLSTLAILLAWVTLSIAWSQDSAAAAGDFYDWYIAAAVFLVVATSFSERRYLPAACAAFVVGGVVSAAIGLVPGAVDRGAIAADEASRLGGSFGDPNFLAAGLVPAIALAAGLATVWRGTAIRATLGAAVLLLAVALAATGSRGGLVAAGVSLVAAIAVARGRRVQLGAWLVLALALVGLWLATSSPSNWERVRSFDTGNGRIDLWTIAWRMTEAEPITGVGVNNFRAASGQYVRQPGRLQDVEIVVDQPHVVHNSYLQQLAETGIVGFTLFVGFLFAVLRATWEAGRRFAAARDVAMAGLARAVLVAQLGILSASIFMSNADDKRIWILLALGPAMLAVAIREANREPSA